jgi:hypothetical protein
LPAQSLRVETEGTKKYSPPLELTKKGFGSPGGGCTPLAVTLAKPDTSTVEPSVPVRSMSALSPVLYKGAVPTKLASVPPGGLPSIGSWPE